MMILKCNFCLLTLSGIIKNIDVIEERIISMLVNLLFAYEKKFRLNANDVMY